MRLASKKVIVTGGASGIGRSICNIFASEGASIVIADIDESGSHETSAQIEAAGGKSLAVTTDVSSDESVSDMIKNCLLYMTLRHSYSARWKMSLKRIGKQCSESM